MMHGAATTLIMFAAAVFEDVPLWRFAVARLTATIADAVCVLTHSGRADFDQHRLWRVNN